MKRIRPRPGEPKRVAIPLSIPAELEECIEVPLPHTDKPWALVRQDGKWGAIWPKNEMGASIAESIGQGLENLLLFPDGRITLGGKLVRGDDTQYRKRREAKNAEHLEELDRAKEAE
jgi:hypothetical protein